jgi:hypothetical protein
MLVQHDSGTDAYTEWIPETTYYEGGLMRCSCCGKPVGHEHLNWCAYVHVHARIEDTGVVLWTEPERVAPQSGSICRIHATCDLPRGAESE